MLHLVEKFAKLVNCLQVKPVLSARICADNLELLLSKVLCLVADLLLSDQLQMVLSTWLDRVLLHCSCALFVESPPQAGHFWWQARVDRHCELMSANFYAELCNLDAQPVFFSSAF